jgi:hypothetical protein
MDLRSSHVLSSNDHPFSNVFPFLDSHNRGSNLAAFVPILQNGVQTPANYLATSVTVWIPNSNIPPGRRGSSHKPDWLNTSNAGYLRRIQVKQISGLTLHNRLSRPRESDFTLAFPQKLEPSSRIHAAECSVELQIGLFLALGNRATVELGVYVSELRNLSECASWLLLDTESSVIEKLVE